MFITEIFDKIIARVKFKGNMNMIYKRKKYLNSKNKGLRLQDYL